MIKTRNYAIDYLKAIAITMIVITHSIASEIGLVIFGPFYIDMAVPVFMIITGYNYSRSAENTKILTIKNWFSISNIKPKLVRILSPYFVVLVIETILIICFSYFGINRNGTTGYILGYLTGGWGPGSYYVPILMELIVIFPVLYISVKKDIPWIWIGALLINIFFDGISAMLSITYDQIAYFYRLLIFRYLGFLLAGIFLYFYQDKIKKNYLFVSLVIGFVYIFAKNYLYVKPMIFLLWPTTSLPTVLWIFPIVVFVMQYGNIQPKNNFYRLFSTIGKASYHIFLTQMVYFFSGFGGLVKRYIGVNAGTTIINITICFTVGILFYILENKIQNLLKNLHQ